ncbi:hypothetical protein BS50DRAFT_597943 [Corynespora cassiicola Philippines]|uniref:NAD(P)-binding domain-containing protein n=1 Tax=Corynespora cassiicola Philippines TaxID=1448308 RepID=A0A2T2NZ61_CORCC|nr:hypothetical protein BS50DRAFT_597943 [Corynespora cassiicola Philippines]
MKVLLIGATGNLGLRLIAALLTHHHTVTAFVRSRSKLESLLPPNIFSQISAVVEGSAEDKDLVKKAVLEHGCEAVVNTAGLAAMPPWGKSDLPEIFKAVVSGVVEAGRERGKPLRMWVLGGMGVLDFPGGGGAVLSDYLPIFLEHRQNLALLQSLPPESVDWSMLCPATMIPESPEISVPTKSSHARLTVNAGTPPAWRDSWFSYLPLIGKTIVCMMNGMNYTTTLEQNADLIAEDLETVESRWSGSKVGIADPSK